MGTRNNEVFYHLGVAIETPSESRLLNTNTEGMAEVTAWDIEFFGRKGVNRM